MAEYIIEDLIITLDETFEDAVNEWVGKAQGFEAEGNAPRALDAWTRAVKASETAIGPRLALARMYKDAARWNQYVDALNDVSKRLPEEMTEEKARLIHITIPVLRDQMKLMPKVVDAYKKILTITPGDDEAFGALVEIIAGMSRWPDLVKLYQERLDSIAEPGRKTELQLEVARLYNDKLHNKREAAKAYEALLELDPQNGEAISSLKEMYEQARDYESLIALHKRELEFISDGDARAEKTLEIAKMASSRLKKPDLLIQLWEEVLAVDPGSIEALENLEQLYEREKNWEKMVQIDRQLLDLVTDRARQVAVCMKLAPAIQEKLEDPAGAVEIWRMLLGLEPDNRRAQDALKKLLMDTGEYDELEDLFRQWEKLEEYIRLISKQSETEADAARKVDLLFREARIWHADLGKADRAMKAHEKVLEVDAANLQAAEALIALYEEAQQFKKLPPVLEIRIRHTEDEEQKRDRMEELARIFDEHLKDKESAFGWYLQAFGLGPDLTGLRDACERLAGAVEGGWSRLVTAYEAAYEACSGPDVAMQLMLVVAGAQENQLQLPEKALATNLKILEIDDASEPALDSLERIYQSRQQWTELLSVYEKKIELAMDDTVRKDLHWKLADIYDTLMEKPGKAVEAYTQALELLPEDLPTMQRLDALYARLEKWQELSDILERQLEIAPDEGDRVELKFRWSEVQESRLDKVEEAIEGYRQVLEWQPGHEGAKTKLERHLDSETASFRRSAADILEPVYKTLMEFENLVKVHEIQAATDDDPIFILDMLVTIGDLWSENIGNNEKALDAYARAVRHSPDSDDARRSFEKVAEIEDRWSTVLTVYSEILEKGALGEIISHTLHVRAAEIARDHLQKVNIAIHHFGAALELDPMNEAVLSALEALYQTTEDWDQLLFVSRKQLELAQELERRQELRFRCGMILDQKLDRAPEAVTLYEEVLGEEPERSTALHALDVLYQKLENWSELADNLTKQLELAEELEDQSELLRRLAAVQHEKLKETTLAIETWRRALDLDPTDDAVISALEKLLDMEDHALVVARILEPVYKNLGRWEPLIRVYEIVMKNSYDPGEQIGLIHQIANIYDEFMEEPRRAFDTYARAFQIDARHADTRRQIERLAQGLSAWEDLFTLYSKTIDEKEDTDVSLDLQTRIADLLATTVGDVERAAAAYGKLLEISPEYIPAVDALEKLFLTTGDIPRMVKAILKKVELVADPEEKKRLAFRVAEIQKTELEDKNAAIATYRLILEIDDTELRALDALEVIFVHDENWESLQEVYARKADLAPSLEERKGMLYTLGQMYDQELHSLEKAIETYERILDEDPVDEVALQSLDRLYEAAGKWQELISVLDVEIQNGQSDVEIAAIKLRLGEVHELRLAAPDVSVPLYGEALNLDSSNEGVIVALSRVMHGGEGDARCEGITYEPEVRTAAAVILDQYYSTVGEQEKLVDVLNVRVAQSEDTYERVQLLHRLKEIHELQLDDPKAARDDMARALHLDPRHEETLRDIEKLSAVIDAWAELIGIYTSVHDQCEEDEDKIFYLHRMARVFEDELADPAQATIRLEAVLKLDAESEAALTGLDRLLEAQARYKELAGILAREVELARVPEEAQNFRYRLARLLVEHLGSPEKGVESYAALLEEAPYHDAARQGMEDLLAKGTSPKRVFEVLEPLYRQDSLWESLVNLHEKYLGFVKEPEERITIYKTICDLQENYLRDPDMAFKTWARAFAEAEEDVEIQERLEGLAAQMALWVDLTDVYRASARKLANLAAANPSRAADLNDLAIHIWLKAARVHEEELSDPAGAEEANLEVLKIDYEHFTALESLDRIYTSNDMFPELAGILDRRAKTSQDAYDRVQFLFRLAKVREEDLRDLPAAVAAFESIVREEEGNIEALEGLERIHFETGDWKALFNVYERMSKALSSDDDVAEALAHMAKIASDALKNPLGAKDLWKRVLELKGEEPRALKELSLLAEAARDWAGCVDFLNRITQASYETGEQVDAYLSVGRIALKELADHRQALDAYQAVRSIDPSNVEALENLAFIFSESQAWEELVEVLEALVGLGQGTMPTSKLRQLYAQIGKIEKEYLMRSERAIAAWENVLQQASGDAEALEALETLYTQSELWTDTIRILEEKVRMSQKDPQKIELLFQIADIYETRVWDKASAANAYGRVLKIDRLHVEAFNQLERLLRDLAKWKELTDLYLKKYGDLGGHEDDVPEQNKAEIVSILQRLAVVYEEKMTDRENAFVALSNAFAIAPMNDVTADHLERIASIQNNWEELIEMYQEAVEAVEDRLVRCDLLVKMGKWYADQLDDLAKATEVLKQALRLEPKYGRVHLQMAEVHRKNQSVGEYISELRLALEVETRQDVVYKSAMELARTYEKEFADMDEAIRFYKKAHEANLAQEEPLEALERLYEKNEKWRELIDIINERVERSTNEEEIFDLKMKISDLYDDRRELPSKAIEVLNELLDAHQDNLIVMRKLEELYEKIGDLEEYLAILERQMNYLSHDDERIRKSHQMAAVWEEHFEKPDKAIECYEAILAISDKDERSYQNLARLYRQEKKWTEYIEVIYRHIYTKHDPKERVRLYKAAAEVLEKQLSEPERAIDAYMAVLDDDAMDIDSLTALSRLYEAQQDWDRCMDVSVRLVDLISDQTVKVDLYFRIGKISEDYQHNPGEAERLYAEALAINPSFVPALKKLSKIYGDRHDWLKAAKMLEVAQTHTANMVDKAGYLYEGGVIRLDHLDDPDRAAELLEACLDIDPEHVDAALRYTDILWSRESFEDMFPHLQMLVRKLEAANADKELLATVYYRYGRSAEARRELEKAQKAYYNAYQIEKTSLPVLQGMASVCYALDQLEQAFKLYKQILVHPQVEGNHDLQTETYFNLGSIHFKRNEMMKAQNLYEKALDNNPNHQPTLRAMVELYEKENNFKAAAEVKSRMAATLSGEERIEFMIGLAEYYRDKVLDNATAIKIFEDAAALDPKNTTIIHELIELYQTTEQWKKVAKNMILLAELETDPKVRSKIWYAVGGVFREYIKSLDDAVDYYNRALDDDPTNLKAFSHTDEILTKKKDWKLQERNYRKMIKRVMETQPENQGLLTNLWHFLGEIYRTRLKDYKLAMGAFETAINLDPSASNRHEILAELYELAGPDTYDKAIAKHHEILDRNAYNQESMKKLYRLYLEVRNYDAAWCMSSALTNLKVAEAEELEFFNQYKPRGFAQLKQRFTNDLWASMLTSSVEDPAMRHLMAAISNPITTLKGRPTKNWGINRKSRQEPAGEGPLFNKIFFYVLDRLAVEAPELYLVPDHRAGMQHGVMIEKGQRIPFVFVGQELLGGHMEKDLAFMVARELTYMRPEYYLLKHVGSVGELRAMIFGSMRLVNNQMPLPADPGVLQQTAAQLAGVLPPASKEVLISLTQKMAATGYIPNVDSFIQGVELTSHRAALTLVQDLDTAMLVIQAEPMIAGGLGLQQKKDALLRFATSEKFFELRKILGVAIG